MKMKITILLCCGYLIWLLDKYMYMRSVEPWQGEIGLFAAGILGVILGYVMRDRKNNGN